MKHWKIQVNGMHCDGCTGEVRASLAGLPGIDVLDVTLEPGCAVLTSDDPLDEVGLRAAISAVGFEAGVLSETEPVAAASAATEGLPSAGALEPAADSGSDEELIRQRVDLAIEGMHCAGCVSHLRAALISLPHVHQAVVNLATQRASVGLDSEGDFEDRLIAAVRQAGYEASLAGSAGLEAARMDARFELQRRQWRRRFVVAAVLTVLQLILRTTNLGIPLGAETMLACGCGLLVQFYVGAVFYRDTWRQIRAGTAGMDTLVVLGTTAAFCSAVPGLLQQGWQLGAAGLGMMADAGMIFSFVSLGRYLESRARRRASGSLKALLSQAPDIARVRRQQIEDVSPHDVAVGETIIIRPGEQVPLDGEVVSGQSELDESWLTGEPLPVSRAAGDPVFAGTINGQGALEVRVSCNADSTAFAGVLELVNQLQQQAAPIQRLADRLVAVFVPLVLLAATVTAASWFLAGDMQQLVRCTIAVLVVACPCALGLATPIALLVAGGRGARLGLLVTNPQSLEAAATVTTVVLDKTGTLTEGKPQVVDVSTRDGVDADQLLCLAASVEAMSFHPLAWAVMEEARKREIQLKPARQVTEMPGEGIQATVDERWVGIGNLRFLERLGISGDEMTVDVEPGRTLLYVVLDGQLAGLLAVDDPVREESLRAVESLHRQGLQTILLSGDRTDVAERVGQRLGISNCRGDLSPEDKQQAISEIQAAGNKVAVVGDGINDAPALIAADLGIAIGAGADVARQSADVVLIASDLSGVPRVLQLSRTTVRIIRQNLAWAGLYNVCLLPLAAGLLQPSWGIGIPPWLAALAMSASSLMVVLNSLRLTRTSLDG
jgi:Cu+-exporting ATPase